jgi:UDP-3-O-[3-hydroxymyristoyl] glucosamine N-acyltransferase
VKEIKGGLGNEEVLSTSNWNIESVLSDMDVSYQVIGSRIKDKRIENVAAIDEATSHDFTFCSQRGDRGLVAISKSKAGLVLCDKALAESISAKPDQLLVLVDNPRLVFMHIANRLRGRKIDFGHKISHSSLISKTASLGKNCSVGNFSVIDESCIIGKNTLVGDMVTIKNCIIGDNCIIQSGVCIGEDGFAYERNNLLELEPFPHYG